MAGLYNNLLQLSRELDDLQHRSALSLKAEDRRSNSDSTSGSISSVASPPGQELQQELDKRLAPTHQLMEREKIGAVAK